MLHNDLQVRIASAAQAVEARMVAVRRDLHAHPELGFELERTAGVVTGELTRLGIPHRTGVGRSGVVGTIEGGRPGPVLVLRADMDALPIQERTGLDFASVVPGRMHACGHDLHTSTLLGVADVLSGLAPMLAGSVRLVFQPAEEVAGGAEAMIADGVLDGAAMAIGFHNYPQMPVGTLGFCRGGCMAAVDVFELRIVGRGGHAAHAYDAVDPIVAAAALIGQLQTIVSREVKAIRACVVTVGAIHAGSAANIIPGECVLRGTVRSFDQDVRQMAEAALQRLCAGVALSMRVRVEVDYTRELPPTVNDGRLLDQLVAAASAQLGVAPVEGEPSMGAEDFSLFAERVPSAHLRVGAGQAGRDDRLHNDDYQPDEGCMVLGLQALCRAAVEILA